MARKVRTRNRVTVIRIPGGVKTSVQDDWLVMDPITHVPSSSYALGFSEQGLQL